MLEIDPHKTWWLLEERLKTEKNPLHRAHLETIVHHMKGEARGDIDQILSTVSPKAVYSAYDSSGNPPRIFTGLTEIRGWYDSLLDTVSVNQEYRVERLVVDDYCIFTEGPTSVGVKGSILQKAGIQGVDPDALYLGGGRTLVIWPFGEDGLLLGENIYSVGSAPLEKVATRKLQPEQIGQYQEAA
jgi:hypothetical protein